MLINRNFFIAGLLLASVVVACIFSIGSIEAAGKDVDRDILFARHLGIFDSTNYSPRMLRRPITEMAFYRGLTRVLTDIGFVRSYDFQEMQRLGILTIKKPGKKISRKLAVETMFRAIMFAINTGQIKNPEKMNTFQPFYDWIIEEKYMQGLSVALNFGIVKGTPGGKFLPASALKTSDALVLFRRFHNAFNDKKSSEVVKTTPSKKAPVQSVKSDTMLSKAQQDEKLNRNRKITIGELSNIIQEILIKAGKPAYISELKYFIRNINRRRAVTRELLTHMGVILLNAMPHNQQDSYSLYSDVKPGTGLARALGFLSRAGIRMGYSNGVLKAKEKVSRYEALSLVNKIMSEAEMRQLNTTKKATKDDFESFKNLLKIKKARIRRILSRNN